MKAKMTLFDYLTRRQTSNVNLSTSIIGDLTTRKTPFLLKPTAIPTGHSDKIFASEWLDEERVICGTKTNQLLVINMKTKEHVSIPTLEGSPDSVMPEVSTGIHDVQINEPRNMLATSGDNPNHLAVYRLPTFDPVCVGEVHSDWVFAVEWLNDTCSHLATGSRDGSIGLWKIQENTDSSATGTRPPVIAPLTTMNSSVSTNRIRDMAYSTSTGHLAALSPLAYIHVWDVATERQVEIVPLPFDHENVCLALQEECSLYAVGSQSHVSLLDARTTKTVNNVMTNDIGAGVRSVSFKDMLVTIGTGHGSVFFYDIRANQFLSKPSSQQVYNLRSGKGWLRPDSRLFEYFTDEDTECFRNAIYTHCYDPTGTKLFTAGGPLALVLYGNYAALWD